MIQIDKKYQPLLLEALEDMMYKLSLELENYKGGAMQGKRKELTDKQSKLEVLQHLVSGE